MITLVSGRLAVLVFIVLIFASFLLSLQRAKKAPPQVRKLGPIDAMKEAVGRAVELGRPVHFTPGYGSAEHAGGLASSKGLALLSGMTILGYVARLCAAMNAQLIATFANPELVPIASDLVRASYHAEKKPDSFKAENIRFISSRQYAYTSGVLGIYQREKVAANIMAGDFGADALILAEGAYGVGAFQVAGSDAPSQLPVIVTVCEYTLIGEELYAAAAYISEDPTRRGLLRGADIFKLGFIAIIVVGTLLEALGIKILSNVLRL